MRGPRIRTSAPILASAIALLCIGVVGLGDQSEAPPTEAYFERVRVAVEGLPYSIDRWIGSDIEVTPAARKLLRPNVIVQRRYVDPMTGDTFSILIVHCGDTRDMRGHYPPICYPAHGWEMESAEQAGFEIDGEPHTLTTYTLAYGSGLKVERMVCMNFFVLPSSSEPITPNMKKLERASHFAKIAALGSAQIQVLFPGSTSEGFREEALKHVMHALSPMLREIESGAL